MSAMEKAKSELEAKIGQELSPPEDWIEVTQERVNRFAEASGDFQWIHVEPERAKDGPFGVAIAHGQLTLSMFGVMAPRGSENERMEGQKLSINYGFNRVRFPAPVPVGSRVRARRILKSVEEKGGMIEIVVEMTVEIDGHDKPACVADRVARLVF